MINYPLSFYAKSDSAAGIQTSWNLESKDFTSPCSIPPEFEGPGGALSPEDLFAHALTNCFVATFKVYAEKSKLHFEMISAQSELVVDLDDDKKPVMKKCFLHVNISGCANPERIRSIANKAFSSGFILNSVKTEMTLHLQVS